MTEVPAPPRCPIHGDMEVVEITQGDILLGFVWFCKVDDCDECEDYDESVYGKRESRFLEMEHEEEAVEDVSANARFLQMNFLGEIQDDQ